MKIAICGAGIGGLTVASLLADTGHDVSVFEQFQTARPIGSGLMVQPYGQRILARLGAWDTALKRGTKISKMYGIEASTGRTVLDESYTLDGDGAYGLAMHRSGLFDALFEAAQARDISFNYDTQISSAAGGYLRTNHGCIGPFDLIIDSLGARSPLSPIKTKPLSYGAVWSTVDWVDGNLPRDHLSQRYQKAEHMIGALSVGDVAGRDSAAIFWSLPVATFDDFRRTNLSDWRSKASKLWPAFALFADQISDMDQFTFARYGHGTLKRPYNDRLVHIGDAAHCASPQLGQGANMAMLDAYALSIALDRTLGEGALQLYAQMRKMHVRAYQALSWTFTPMYQSSSTVLPWLRDRILFPVSRVPLVKRQLSHLVRGELVPPLRGEVV